MNMVGQVAALISGPQRKRTRQTVRPGQFDVDGHSVQLGSFRVFRTFSTFAMPLALYACQKLLLKRKVSGLMAYTDLAAPPPQEVIQTDVSTHETVFTNYLARVGDLMVACAYKPEGLMVAAYAASEEAALAFFDELEAEISFSNIYRGKCLYFSGSGIEFKPTPPVQWDEVILSRRLKDEILLNTAKFLRNPKLHKKGILKRGIILHGAPGTGKTTLVRAIFRALEGSDVTRIYVTNEAFSHMGIDDFFKMIRYVLPAIVVFEDIDLIGPARHIHRGGIIGSLLTHLDGVDKVTQPLVVVGTTNDFESVDEALVNRPARFDRVLEVPRPSPAEIRAFYRKLGGFEADDALVEASEGFTGAHIEEVVKTCIMMADEAEGGGDPASFVLEAVRTVRASFGGGAPAGFRQRRGHDEETDPLFGVEEVGIQPLMPAQVQNPLTLPEEARPDDKNLPEAPGAVPLPFDDPNLGLAP